MSSPHQKRTYDSKEDYYKHLEKRLHDLEEFMQFLLVTGNVSTNDDYGQPGSFGIKHYYDKWLKENKD